MALIITKSVVVNVAVIEGIEYRLREGTVSISQDGNGAWSGDLAPPTINLDVNAWIGLRYRLVTLTPNVDWQTSLVLIP